MKQNIDLSQLNELSDKGKRKLEDWTFEHIIMTQKKFVPLLSIGQMIEFLDEHELSWNINALTNQERFYYLKTKSMEKRGVSFSSDTELCDALWEAVRAVLDTTSQN